MHENRPQLAAFCGPAAAYCGPRRTLVGALAIVLLPVLVIAALLAGFYYALIPWLESRQMGSGYVWVIKATTLGTEAVRGQTPRGVLLMLGSVIIVIPSLWVVLRWLHKRPLRSLFGPTWRLSWRHVAIGVGVVLLASLIRPSLYMNALPSLAMPAGTWLLWMLVALPVLFAQSMTEELFFRGYLQQQLAARFASRWAWLVLPSVLFGLIHYNPDAPQLFNVLNVAALGIMGAIAADVTARTGNLGAAIGLHFGNNLYLLMLHSKYSAKNGLALLQSGPIDDPQALIQTPIDHVIPLIIVYVAYRAYLARPARD